MEQEALHTIAELFSLGRILMSALVLLGAALLLKLLFFLTRVLTARFAKHRLQLTRFFPVVRLSVWIFAFYIIIVHIFRPEQNAVLALTASVGLAFGLAAQDVVRNILSGVLLLFDQPFRVGDMVQIDQHYGEVVSIGLRSVRIHTFDDSIVTVPNAMVLSQAVSNSNAGDLDEMVVVEFDLPATVNIQEVKQLAREAATSSPYVYLKKPVAVLVEDRARETFLTHFKVKAYVLDVRLERVLASDILERIKMEILARGILTPDMVVATLEKSFNRLSRSPHGPV